MKITIKILFTLFIALLVITGCKTSKKSSGYMKVDVEAKNAELQINFGAPINTADKQELSKTWYTDNRYFLLQSKKNQFKDNAPFIEYLDGGKRERMWFTTTRADEQYKNVAPTNLYQQIYYCEREIGNGKCPGEGWSEPVKFSLSSDKVQLHDYIEGFNKATKGAVTVSGNTMIFSCDQWNERENWNTIRSKIRNLWEIDLSTLPNAYPVQIMTVSSVNTWESQPALSPDGKHLFFVSNRVVNAKDYTWSTDTTGADINLFYSFRKDGNWGTPVLVKELYTASDEITPHVSIKGDKLFFSSNKSGNYEIYEVELSLNSSDGGYTLNTGSLKLFDSDLIDLCDKDTRTFRLNGMYDQKYPCYYYNPVNGKNPQAFIWSSNNPEGLGSFDIYGCSMPFKVTYNVVLADLCPQGGNDHVQMPVIELTGAKSQIENSEKAQFSLLSGLSYTLKGGSMASAANGTYACDVDPSYVFIGYSKPNLVNPLDKKYHSTVITGPVIESENTRKDGKIYVTGIVNDITINDTVYVTKAWEKKSPCPGKLNIEPTYRKVAYFQTGYWEVNTTENLKRDLINLHEGFEVTGTNDIYNPTGKIARNRSDYKAVGYDAPMFPIKTNDRLTYSIANAPWIELHPNNQYWGDRPGSESKLSQRMVGRKDRINQYVEYAKKVDKNLENLTDTIKNKYIHLLDLHKEMKPKLLIEIIAVSDPREVSRSWYIGETVQYRESLFNESTKTLSTPVQVKIVQPDVDENTKTIYNIKPCTEELNKDGDNGSILGILSNETDKNTNLSRLRAWYGYKEVYKKLTESAVFNRFLKEGKVALPDNNVSYDDADIIIITYGVRKDRDDKKDPQFPYPAVNNPTGNGYFDYDEIRRMEIQTRLIFGKEKEKAANYCCDPTDTK